MRIICVLQRGWVVVGDVAKDDPDGLRLENASVIRRWGTTEGLGELALKGPIKGKTVLDYCGVVEAHPQAVVLRMACEASAWS